MNSTEEQDELRLLVRRFLEEKSSSHRVRELLEAGASRDEAVWRQMAEQLGLQGIAIPEELGGSGGGPAELGIVLEEMGRVLLIAPYLSSVVFAGQLLTSSDDTAAQQRWLPGIADGSLTAALALTEESGAWDLVSVSTVATPSDDGWVLRGEKHFVVDGHTADLLFVVARTDDGVGVFAVESDAVGMTREAVETLDVTRALATVALQDVPAIRVGEDADATAWLDRVRDLVLTAVAAEQIGGASRCLDLAVEHALVREQFGRLIGSFQAIKHTCAQLLIEIESGRSAVYHASRAVADHDADAAISAALAKAYCSTVFTHAAKDCIQVHGGIGYTWEHDAHLFLRRAKSSELLFGTPAAERARLADLVGI